MELCHTETNAFGVTRKFYIDDEGNVTVDASQDLEQAVSWNRSQANERGKRITSDYSNPVATIPPIVALKWLNEEGWWVFDPDCADKLKRKLNDPDWRYLRTSELYL